MKKSIIIASSILLPFLTLAQKKVDGTFKVRKMYDNEVFTIVEEMPTFPGGGAALIRFLSVNTVYPASAKMNGISGTVYIRFKVDTTGNIKEVKVLRGVSKLLDDEALRVIKSMPKWAPGKQDGKNVTVAYNFPINFSLK